MKRIGSFLLAILVVISMIPSAVFADPASNEVLNNQYVSVNTQRLSSIGSKSLVIEIYVNGLFKESSTVQFFTNNPGQTFVSAKSVYNFDTTGAHPNGLTLDGGSISNGHPINIDYFSSKTLRIYLLDTTAKPTITWTRSRETSEVSKNINIKNWNWDTVKNVATSESAKVWDGNTNDHYYTNYLSNSTQFPSATWKLQSGSDLRRFRGTFSFPTGFDSSDFIRLRSVNQSRYSGINDGNIIPINDNIYIFFYKQSDYSKITNDNFMNYLAFWSGTSNQDGLKKFNEVDGTLTDQSSSSNLNHTDGWYCNADLDNIGKKFLANYPIVTPGETYVFDIFVEDYNSGGGMDQMEVQFVKNTAPMKDVTVQYLKKGTTTVIEPSLAVTAKAGKTIDNNYIYNGTAIQKDIPGYKYVSMDPTTGLHVTADGTNVLKLYYEVDTSAKVLYDVNYFYDNVKDASSYSSFVLLSDYNSGTTTVSSINPGARANYVLDLVTSTPIPFTLSKTTANVINQYYVKEKVNVPVKFYTQDTSAGVNKTEIAGSAVTIDNVALDKPFSSVVNAANINNAKSAIPEALRDYYDDGAIISPSSVVTRTSTIEVVFTKKSYDITASVVGTGGTISPSGTTSVLVGNDQLFSFIPDPGYKVKAVITDEGSQATQTSYNFENVGKPHTISVEFEKIMYNVNFVGGEATSGTAPTSIQAGVGDTITLPGYGTLAKAHFTFAGWKQLNGPATVYAANSSFSPMPENDITFVAQWTEDSKYTATFVHSPGQITTQSKYEGETVTLPANVGSVPNSTFVGWSYVLRIDPYDVGDTFSMPKHDIIVTAIWSPNLNARFDDGIDSTDTHIDIPSYVGGKITMPAADTFTNPNHTFTGWKLDTPIPLPIGMLQPGAEFITLFNVTFTAQWQENPKFAVTYVLNGGTSSTEPSTPDQFGTDVFNLPTEEPTMDGHRFLGWSDGTSNYLAGAQYTMNNAPVTFTAQWEDISVPNPDANIFISHIYKVNNSNPQTVNVQPYYFTGTITFNAPTIQTLFNGYAHSVQSIRVTRTPISSQTPEPASAPMVMSIEPTEGEPSEPALTAEELAAKLEELNAKLADLMVKLGDAQKAYDDAQKALSDLQAVTPSEEGQAQWALDVAAAQGLVDSTKYALDTAQGEYDAVEAEIAALMPSDNAPTAFALSDSEFKETYVVGDTLTIEEGFNYTITITYNRTTSNDNNNDNNDNDYTPTNDIILINDELVPLGKLPKTGGNSAGAIGGLLIVSGAFSILFKKKNK